MVFEEDNMYGAVNTELSKVEAVYVKGVDITEEEFIAQQETDKTWLITEENLENINIGKKKSILKSFALIFLIAAGFTWYAINAWIENTTDYRDYEDYVMVEGIVTEDKYINQTERYRYEVEYIAEDGKKYTHCEELKEIDSKMPIVGEDVPIIYKPEDYEDAYIGISKHLPERYVPAKYASVVSYYLICVMAIAFDLGAVALALMTVNKTASRYFRLLIPICLIAFSVMTAIMCGMLYHIWTFIFTVIFILMLFIRMKKGFRYTGNAQIMIGGQNI